MEKAKQIVALASPLVLAIVFLWAGATKAAAPSDFREAILGFRIVGETPATVAAYYIPWLEIVAATALLRPATRHGALIVSAALLSIFTVALVSTCARGIDPSCGCFGEASPTGCAIPITRNIALLALAGLPLAYRSWKWPRSSKSRGAR